MSVISSYYLLASKFVTNKSFALCCFSELVRWLVSNPDSISFPLLCDYVILVLNSILQLALPNLRCKWLDWLKINVVSDDKNVLNELIYCCWWYNCWHHVVLSAMGITNITIFITIFIIVSSHDLLLLLFCCYCFQYYHNKYLHVHRSCFCSCDSLSC